MLKRCTRLDGQVACYHGDRLVYVYFAELDGHKHALFVATKGLQGDLRVTGATIPGHVQLGADGRYKFIKD